MPASASDARPGRTLPPLYLSAALAAFGAWALFAGVAVAALDNAFVASIHSTVISRQSSDLSRTAVTNL